jgi:hypothetical protein
LFAQIQYRLKLSGLLQVAQAYVLNSFKDPGWDWLRSLLDLPAHVEQVFQDEIARALALEGNVKTLRRASGKASGKARRSHHAKIRREAVRMEQEGHEKREIAGKLALKFNMSPGYIRRVLNSQKKRT